MPEDVANDGAAAASAAVKTQMKKRKKRNKKNKKAAPAAQQAHQEEDEYEGGPTDEDYSDTQCEKAEEYRKGGYHPVHVGELYNKRYRIVHKLGWGYFSTVWLVWDQTEKDFKAVKIQKSAQHYTEAALDEIRLLEQISGGDPTNEKCCARMCDHFEHIGQNGKHVCMVFEVLGQNLLSLITKYDYKGIPLPIVKQVTKQVLVGLDYLHRELGIIHTDLKPENVLLREPPSDVQDAIRNFVPPDPTKQISLMERDPSKLSKNQKKRLKRKMKQQQSGSQAGDGDDDDDKDEIESLGGDKKTEDSDKPEGAESEKEDKKDKKFPTSWDIKLADFGNGCWIDRQFTDEIQTRQYRAPEVILGDGYLTPVDIWSLAAMVFELITGDFLFDPRPTEYYDRDEDHLALIIELLGHLPPALSQGKGKFRSKFLTPQGQLRHISELKFWPLEDVLREKYKFTDKKAHEIAEFLLPMLGLDPAQRATAAEMLYHPWLEVQEDDEPDQCHVQDLAPPAGTGAGEYEEGNTNDIIESGSVDDELDNFQEDGTDISGASHSF